MAEPFHGRFDTVAGAEARGFILAAAIAYATGTGLLPLRKPGKLPPPVISERHDLEYGSAELQLRETVGRGRRVLLVDDVLATGGTLVAARRLLEKAGDTVVGAAVVIELAELGGRAAFGDLRAVRPWVRIRGAPAARGGRRGPPVAALRRRPRHGRHAGGRSPPAREGGRHGRRRCRRRRAGRARQPCGRRRPPSDSIGH